jgi:hypothetical protein
MPGATGMLIENKSLFEDLVVNPDWIGEIVISDTLK